MVVVEVELPLPCQSRARCMDSGRVSHPISMVVLVVVTAAGGLRCCAGYDTVHGPEMREVEGGRTRNGRDPCSRVGEQTRGQFEPSGGVLGAVLMEAVVGGGAPSTQRGLAGCVGGCGGRRGDGGGGREGGETGGLERGKPDWAWRETNGRRYHQKHTRPTQPSARTAAAAATADAQPATVTVLHGGGGQRATWRGGPRSVCSLEKRPAQAVIPSAKLCCLRTLTRLNPATLTHGDATTQPPLGTTVSAHRRSLRLHPP